MRWLTPFTIALLVGASLACATGKKTSDGEEDPGLLGDQDGDDDGYTYDQDCNDDNAAINPGAQEVCDPADVDEDCDGLSESLDESASGTISAWHDADSDGYGDPNNPATVCELSAGFVGDDTDCDDTDPAINPGAVEICDFEDTDEDCTGTADNADEDASEATMTTWYRDADADGYGDSSGAGQTACDGPDGFVDDHSDCDDADPAVHPGAEETWYDGDDTDCDGGSDLDQDGDGYLAESQGGTDCDDRASAVYPGATDRPYDGVDADCAGDSDYDVDGDGHDSDAYGGDDCDDTDAAIYYGAYETGTEDNNCDGVVEATPQADADYDAGSSTFYTCDPLYLDGSGSRDPGGDALTYAWTLTDVPTGAPETTSDIYEPDDESPTFIPSFAGDYTFELVVTNESSVASFADSVVVPITERPTNDVPVADAGTNQTESETVTCTAASYSTYTCDSCSDVVFSLDAGATTDGDGDSLTYTWAITSGTGELSADEGETVRLVAPGAEATYGSTTTDRIEVTLTVTDCYGDTDTDTITLTTECTGE